MSKSILWVIILILLIAVAYLGWREFSAFPSAQAPATSTPAKRNSTKPDTSAPLPLSKKVTVAEPKEGAVLGRAFTVAGKAPGPWFFEATFPIQVRDDQGNVIGRSHANAQGEWTTENLVAFTATVNIDANYSGPATLILLKDNPSGLPENDDSVSFSIVIK